MTTTDGGTSDNSLLPQSKQSTPQGKYVPPKSPVWHPFAQHAIMTDFPALASARGAYLYTQDGTRILDAISSWWVVTHGHCHPRLQAAITAQAAKLDQVIFANYTHQPAEDLATALIAMTPAGLDYVFYSDSGSTAVEVALKMALGYWAHIGQPRRRLLVLEHGYHGDTIGTMSVGARGVFNAAYEPLLFDVETIPFPSTGREQYTLDALERLCKPMAGNISSPSSPAAFIVEPMVVGAGGMKFYNAATLAEMKRICERYGVLFIADEVMTGWGRTGALFACDHAGIVPDILCTSKGLTGGALPLAVTICAAKIFDAHFTKDRNKTFFHSSSFTANPIACAAALENLAIWAEEPVMGRITSIEAWQQAGMTRLHKLGGIENLRRCGTIVAMELTANTAGYLSELGPQLMAYFASRGLLLRPLGNTLYIMPPYCITEQDLDEIYAAIADSAAKFASSR